ncbi:MAG: hypothetical protein AAEC86_06885 [Pseudohongiellaceae bacterium]
MKSNKLGAVFVSLFAIASVSSVVAAPDDMITFQSRSNLFNLN